MTEPLWQDPIRILQAIVLVYQVTAVAVFASSFLFAFPWLKAPFTGGVFEQTLVLNGSKSAQPGQEWSLYAQGAKLGDKLISMANIPVYSGDDINRVLMRFSPGETIPIVLRDEKNELKTYDITLEAFSPADRTAYFVLPGVLSFAFLLISLWIFDLRRAEPAGRAFAIFTSSLAIVTISNRFSRIAKKRIGGDFGGRRDLF